MKTCYLKFYTDIEVRNILNNICFKLSISKSKFIDIIIRDYIKKNIKSFNDIKTYSIEDMVLDTFTRQTINENKRLIRTLTLVKEMYKRLDIMTHNHASRKVCINYVKKNYELFKKSSHILDRETKKHINDRFRFLLKQLRNKEINYKGLISNVRDMIPELIQNV